MNSLPPPPPPPRPCPSSKVDRIHGVCFLCLLGLERRLTSSFASLPSPPPPSCGSFFKDVPSFSPLPHVCEILDLSAAKIMFMTSFFSGRIRPLVVFCSRSFAPQVILQTHSLMPFPEPHGPQFLELFLLSSQRNRCSEIALGRK